MPVMTHVPHSDMQGRPLPGSEYIGENCIRMYLSVLMGQWESKQAMLDVIRPAVEFHMERMPHGKPKLFLVNSYSVSEIDVGILVAAAEAFDQAVREYKPNG
jgi:hypothetical protein